MVSKHGWQSLLVPFRARDGAATLARVWGCSWPNRYLDGAASYRRLAATLILLPIPFAAIGLAMIVRVPSAGGYAAAHFLLAGCCAWLAIDLVRLAGMTSEGRPHLSALALTAGLVLMVVVRPIDADSTIVGFGAPVLIWPAIVGLVASVAVDTVAERRSDQVLLVAGRWAAVGGAVTVGAAGLGQAARALPVAPVAASGLGVLAVILLAMGYFESRVLLRGVALLRTSVHR